MTKVEGLPNKPEIAPNLPIFPISPEIIKKYFDKIPEKDPAKYRELFLDKIFRVYNHDPSLFSEIIRQRNLLTRELPQLEDNNFFNTGGCIMYEIIANHASIKNFELPLIEGEYKKSNMVVRPYRKVKTVDFQDFAFIKDLGQNDKSYLKKGELIRDLSLLANEEPNIYQRLRIPNNPTMLIGASYVYSRYREVHIPSSQIIKTV